MFNSFHHQDPKHLGKVLVERGIDFKNISEYYNDKIVYKQNTSMWAMF